MPVIFEYVPRRTPLHKLNPLSKLIMIISIFIVVSLYWDPIYLTPILIISCVIYALSRTPFKWLLVAAPFMLYRVVESFILGIALSDPSLYKHLQPEVAGMIVFKIGPFTLVYGGLLWCLANVIKIACAAMLTFMFIYTTSLNDIIRLLQILRIPQKITYIVILVLRLVPELWRELVAIYQMFLLKGVCLKTFNIVKIGRLSMPMITCFFRRLIQYVNDMTIMAYIRGFGEVSYATKGFKLSIADLVIIILSIAFSSISVYALVVYGIGLI